jgi:SAM-dependent methyltransferase
MTTAGTQPARPLPGGLPPETSRLLDIRDCERDEFRALHQAMRSIALQLQPSWFRPLLLRSARLKSYTGFDHWSRAWEYPWAVLAAQLPDPPARILDVGGGGSAFAYYLAERGYECVVADPSLNEGTGCVYDRERSPYQNARSMIKRIVFRAAGIHSVWGLPEADRVHPVRFVADRADKLSFPDRHFDRVFCLSVIEHIPPKAWPGCIREMERVLRPGGRLVITEDMTPEEADAQVYRRLVDACRLRLLGEPRYAVPIPASDARLRHPGQGYETIGLVWESPVAVDG